MTTYVKSFQKPDETRQFGNGHLEVLQFDDRSTIGRGVFAPGWKWSNDVKPVAKTELCEAPHFLYQLSGRMKVVMKDGREFESGPGDVALIPPGHDAWVVGNEAVEVIDWGGAANYAKG